MDKLKEKVAKEVLGWTYVKSPVKVGENAGWKRPGVLRPRTATPDNLPHYDSDISAAWEVVEAMEVKGWKWHAKTVLGCIKWAFREKWTGDPKSAPMETTAIEETVPEAICHAALAAVRRQADG